MIPDGRFQCLPSLSPNLRHSTGERLPNVEPLSRVQLLTEDDVCAALDGDILTLVARTIN